MLKAKPLYPAPWKLETPNDVWPYVKDAEGNLIFGVAPDGAFQGGLIDLTTAKRIVAAINGEELFRDVPL